MSEPTTSHDDLDFELPQAVERSRAKVAAFVVIAVAIAVAIAYAMRSRAHAALDDGRASSGLPRVEPVAPKSLTSDQALALPGIVRAFEETKLYPRTTGYVRKWLVDIGDRVSAGQLLVEIESPDVDAQLAQARAQLAQAKAAVTQAIAQRNYSKGNDVRYKGLADQQLIARQQVEQTTAQAQTDEAIVAADQAAVVAADANVRRLSELVAFEKMTAPFAGTITTRNVERGALVSETSQTALPMYTLVATDPVRVFIDVPQTVAPSVTNGAEAVVTAREYAGRQFPGKVTRSAGALDPDLHTMSTEVQVPNADGALLPGMYVTVAVKFTVPHRAFEVPATALYNDAQGLRIAVIGPQSKVHFVPITIERDNGATLWIASGLTGDEKLIKVAVPALAEGDTVEVETPVAPTAAQGSAGSASH